MLLTTYQYCYHWRPGVTDCSYTCKLSLLSSLYPSLPGALIYLLDLFCNSTHPQVRSQTAELFSKMTSDKLVGPKVSMNTTVSLFNP